MIVDTAEYDDDWASVEEKNKRGSEFSAFALLSQPKSACTSTRPLRPQEPGCAFQKQAWFAADWAL